MINKDLNDNFLAKKTTIDDVEVDKFRKIAAQWWDPSGKFKPLHKLNPVRLKYIRDSIINHFDINPNKNKPLSGLKILDIGCGGGLICEALCNMGAIVDGIDAVNETIEVAKLHAKDQGLEINYMNCAIEDMNNDKIATYDVVLNLEIIEHVAAPREFISMSAQMLKPNGLFILSTLNRTIKSFAFGIIAAEYLLRWLPIGTHKHSNFKKPSQLANYLTDTNFKITELMGITYNPINDEFSLNSNDLSVNYMALAKSLNTKSLNTMMGVNK